MLLSLLKQFIIDSFDELASPSLNSRAASAAVETGEVALGAKNTFVAEVVRCHVSQIYIRLKNLDIKLKILIIGKYVSSRKVFSIFIEAIIRS